MGFPAARLTDTTATGDIITGPGAPTVIIGGMPASVMGDLVSGPVCVGSISMGSPTVLICGRPAARATSQVTGANPASGAPVTTVVVMGCITVLIA